MRIGMAVALVTALMAGSLAAAGAPERSATINGQGHVEVDRIAAGEQPDGFTTNCLIKTRFSAVWSAGQWMAVVAKVPGHLPHPEERRFQEQRVDLAHQHQVQRRLTLGLVVKS